MTIKGLEQTKRICYKCKQKTFSFDYRDIKGKQKVICMDCIKEMN